ncbi:ninein-like protein isoform X2 [Anas acuta]|uniref:ninein-like protein isoform X2 n=1 Tax=Anas acuta TaxID=28680 RepID=UPI0035C8AC27
MVPRSGLQHAAVTSYANKLQCLRIQVKQICRERDKARLDLEKAERRCLQLGRELDEQYIALEHSQGKLKDVQAEMQAKELLLQQALNHQAKLEADTQLLQGKEASLHGRLNLMMRENTQLQNKVREMTEKLMASEKLVLELQKELNLVVQDKLEQVEPHSPELLTPSERFAEIVLEYERQCQVLWDQNGVLRRELEALRLQLQQESRAERGLLAAETSLTTEQLREQLQDLKVQLETKVNYYEKEVELMKKNFEREKKNSKKSVDAEMSKVEGQKRDLEETVARRHVSELGREEVQELAETPELMESSEKSKREVSQLNTKLCQLSRELPEHEASRSISPATAQLQSQRLVEAEELQGAEMAARTEHHGQHATCWTELELLWQQLRASQEKLLEAKASLSLAQTRHALQLQQAKAQMNNMVPKKQFEQLQASLREEQSRAQWLQENLHRQAEQAHRQLLRTQEEHERLLQVAMEQAEGLESELRSAEAVLADRAAHLKDTQAQLSRNKLLIAELREENRGFAMALQAAELKQKSTEEKNQVLEEQALALKQLIGKITPASLSV